MRYLLHPEADEELAEAVGYYTQIEPELGIRFYREMQRLLRAVCADPQRFYKFDPPADDTLAPSSPMRSFTWRNPITSGSSPSCT